MPHNLNIVKTWVDHLIKVATLDLNHKKVNIAEEVKDQVKMNNQLVSINRTLRKLD